MRLLSLLSSVMLLAQCGTSPHHEVAHPEPPTKPITAAPTPPLVVFDLNTLYGLTIDQLKAKLGKPTEDTEDNMDGSVRDCLFKKRGFLLIANYVVKSRQVDILHFIDEAGKTPYRELLSLSNADTASTRYTVTPSPSPYTGNHIGLAITPIRDAQTSE